ncbi:MAG TPA: hypothetical protein VFS90_23605 [Pyrinomonadaceae bacterium]|nr:hypothetical protein [Pyrinomonadaceae bacterium]
MQRQFLASLSILGIIVLFGFTARLNRSASASPQKIKVISRTNGDEALTAELVDDQIRIRLKNNHKSTITAFAISFGNTKVKEDFAYSDVHLGIDPGDTFQASYALSPSPVGELPTLSLLTVLLKDGTNDGDSKVAREIKDERLGEKIQVLRMLKILEKEGQSHKDLKLTKSDIVAALNMGEVETLVTLNELEPTSRIKEKISDQLRNGLQVGREKMLRRFEVLEQLQPEYREQGFMELKERSHKLFAKL